ncbi:MAG: hypothetical protein K6D91_05980 [Prevotella sp.]|nr:hypothetical protein [Prevotella sp.]
MGVKESNIDVTAILLGDVPVEAVYLGSEEVWSNSDEPTQLTLNAVLSCFGMGMWVDNLTWNDIATWSD